MGERKEANMNLVFFDIECASVTQFAAKICAFGYVLCDEEFNVLEKEDILINPRGGFHLTDYRGKNGIVLPYRHADFRKCPPFPAAYRRIRPILENRNNTVIGHAIQNDVKFLNLETKRYSLPSFNFTYYDTQVMYMTAVGDYSHQIGLETIAQDLGAEYTAHRAVDDAYVTMEAARTLCSRRGTSFSSLVKSLGIFPGRIKNYSLIPPTSCGQQQYMKANAEKKAERVKLRERFSEYVSKKKRTVMGPLSGKIFNFSRQIEENTERAESLIDFLYSNGGEYVRKVEKCNVYVCDTGDESGRTELARREGVHIISPAELLEMKNV